MKLKATTIMRTAVSALALSFAAGSAPTMAQAQAAAPGAPPLGWFKTCTKQDDSDLCVVQNVMLAQNGQLITAVGLITVEGKVNRKILQVSVPTARLIPPGITMQIDGGKGQKLDYAVCLPSKCQAPVDAPGAPPRGCCKTGTKQDDSDLCVVQNGMLAQNGQLITAVGRITDEGKVNRKILQVSVPTARRIPPGITMQIDGGKGQKLDYAVCLPDKCTAEVPLTDAMIASLQKGGEVVFTSINFQIGSAHVCTPVTNAHLVCRLLLEKINN